MPTFKSSHLPDKVRLCLIAAGSGRTVAGMPVQLVVQSSDSKGAIATQSIGLLASNHAGYLSFNLGRRKGRLPEVMQSIHALVPTEPPTRLDLTDRLVQPRDQLSPPSGSGRLLPEIVPVPLPDQDGHEHQPSSGLNSIEDPDVDDWVQSPGSFASDPTHVLGGEDCEMLLPSRAAERIVRFHRLVRTHSEGSPVSMPFAPSPSYDEGRPQTEPGWPPELSGRTGEVRHYELIWRPLGHALGKVLYSLTLAPCEAVRIAVLEWARTEEATRTERGRLSDQLAHSLRRDRAVEEIVNAVLQERQNGESFMGGMAGVGGYGGGMGGGGMGMPGGGSSSSAAGAEAPEGGSAPAASESAGQSGGQKSGQNWGITGSHALGYAMANSSGNREVDVETIQNLVDEIAQASHLVRDLQSTVIVQASQAEREIASTRIVRNHNHSHALTVLYYEVVRHYLVQALHRRTQPVVFVRYPVTRFDQSVATRRLLRAKAGILRSSLLDPRFAAGFDALYPVDDSDSISRGGARILSLTVNIATGEDSTEHDRLKLLMITSAGLPIVKSASEK